MDFEDISLFKWLFIAMGIFMVVSGIHDVYKTHVNAQIEIEKIKSGNCK